MGVAVPRASVGTRSPEPPQKFGHGPLFVGQLLSRNQVSQKNQGELINEPTSIKFGAYVQIWAYSFWNITQPFFVQSL